MFGVVGCAERHQAGQRSHSRAANCDWQHLLLAREEGAVVEAHTAPCYPKNFELPQLYVMIRQATEHASHKWTVYARHTHGEDLSYILEKVNSDGCPCHVLCAYAIVHASQCLVRSRMLQVTFDLHSSFANPRRDVEFQPYELTEVGWGEFDIIIRVRRRIERRLERDVSRLHNIHCTSRFLRLIPMPCRYIFALRSKKNRWNSTTI